MRGVPPLDEFEYARWRDTAELNREAARVLARAGLHAAVVLHAEQAVQCALKGLLHGVGRPDLARGHGLRALARAAAAHAALPLVAGDEQDLARLAREYAPTRYPDAVPGDDAPREAYDADDAAWATGVTNRLLAGTDAAWAAVARP